MPCGKLYKLLLLRLMCKGKRIGHPIRGSVIGSHATVAANCVVEDSVIRDSILDEGAVVQRVSASQSLIGRNAKVNGRFRMFNVGEASEVGFE